MSVNKINLTIVDGLDVEVAEGSSVLQTCEVLGLEIPRFCFHERLLIVVLPYVLMEIAEKSLSLRHLVLYQLCQE